MVEDGEDWFCIVNATLFSMIVFDDQCDDQCSHLVFDDIVVLELLDDTIVVDLLELRHVDDDGCFIWIFWCWFAIFSDWFVFSTSIS